MIFESLKGYRFSCDPLLQTRDQIRVRFHYVQLTPEKYRFQSVFAQKLRFLSPHKSIDIPFTRISK